MQGKQFEYSTLVSGSYRGMLCLIPLILLIGINIFLVYCGLMLFLGFGLRPLLEKTGLYRQVSHYFLVAQEKSSAKFMEKRAVRIDRKRRDDKYRRRRVKHPGLPKNW